MGVALAEASPVNVKVLEVAELLDDELVEEDVYESPNHFCMILS